MHVEKDSEGSILAEVFVNPVSVLDVPDYEHVRATNVFYRYQQSYFLRDPTLYS